MFVLVAPLILLTTPAVSGAELYTSQSWGYGRFEARLRFAPSDGVVSSFFLWKPDSEMPEVYWNEVDIEKIGPECTYSTNVFWGMPEMQMPEEIEIDLDVCGAWHTHAIEWTPEAIVWKLDGEELRRVEGELAAEFAANAQEGLQFRFNLWVGTEDFGGSFSADRLPVYQFIDWVAYSEYLPQGPAGEEFALEWREDFTADELPSSWATGSWESPLGQSVHAPENVVVVDGVAVLALTADDALGFEGTPPDPDEEGETTGASASSGAEDEDASDAGSSSVGASSEDAPGDSDATTAVETTAGETTAGETTAVETTGATSAGDSSSSALEASGSADSMDASAGETVTSGSNDEPETSGSGCSCRANAPAPSVAGSLWVFVLLGALGSPRRRKGSHGKLSKKPYIASTAKHGTP